MKKLDNGQVLGKCNACGADFMSDANSLRAAEDELQRMFDAHVCGRRNKTREDMDTEQSAE